MTSPSPRYRYRRDDTRQLRVPRYVSPRPPFSSQPPQAHTSRHEPPDSVPKVTPNSRIYFLQFTSGTEHTWTTRFTVRTTTRCKYPPLFPASSCPALISPF